jgi:hypothetical protein
MYPTVPIMTPTSVLNRPGDILTGIQLSRLRQAEVEELGPALPREHHVLRLQVAMHDAERMCGAERVGDLRPDIDDAPIAECSFIPEQHAKAYSVDEFGDEITDAGLMASIMDDDDSGMIEV